MQAFNTEVVHLKFLYVCVSVGNAPFDQLLGVGISVRDVRWQEGWAEHPELDVMESRESLRLIASCSCSCRGEVLLG